MREPLASLPHKERTSPLEKAGEDGQPNQFAQQGFPARPKSGPLKGRPPRHRRMGHVATKSRANDPMSRLVSWVVKICLIVVVVDALVHRWFPLSREGVPSKANSKLTELTQEVRPGAEDKRAAAPDWETAAQPSSVADIDPRNGSEPWEVLPRRSDWEDGQIPAWCDKLMLEPRPWTATPGTPPELKRCGRRTDEGECFDGSPITFFSQHHQGKYDAIKGPYGPMWRPFSTR